MRLVAKKRILFFAYNGTGWGHLMRLVNIASEFRDDYLPIIVTSHTAVSDLVIPGVEFCRIPDLDPFGGTDVVPNCLEVVQFRKRIIARIVKTIKPSVIITDHKPVGKKEELLDTLTDYDCLKYLILRGIVGSQEKIEKKLFSPKNNEVIENYYKRVFVASIPSIDDFSNSEFIPNGIKNKFQHIGFVTRHIDSNEIERTRILRGLHPQDKWIVCSAGGGRLGDSLIKQCIELSSNPKYADYYFDVVFGGYSDVPWPNELYDTIQINDKVNFSRKSSALPLMHSAADFVICSGGYNSLMESMQGREKHVFAYSVQQDIKEQSINIEKLGEYYSIHEIGQLDRLEAVLQNYVGVPPKATDLPDMNGAMRIKTIIENDLINS